MEVREKDLYMTMLSLCLNWSFTIIVFLGMGLAYFLNSKHEFAEASWDKSCVAESYDASVELNRDASAHITESWNITSTKEGNYFSINMCNGGIVPDENNFITVNGKSYIQTNNSKINPGEYTFKHSGSSENVDLRFDGAGSMRVVCEYTIPDFLGKLEYSIQDSAESRIGSGAAMTFMTSKGYSLLIRKASVRVFMKDEDLSQNAVYSEAEGFHGIAGFDGTQYRVETLEPLVDYMGKMARIEIQLLLSTDHFNSLPEGYTPPKLSSLNFKPSRYLGVIGWTLALISRIAAVSRFILAAAIALEFYRNRRWVWRKEMEITDAQLISEINLRHWKRHLLVTLVLAIALFIALILSLFTVPVSTIVFTIGAPCFIACLIIIDMIFGLRTLRKIDRLV